MAIACPPLRIDADRSAQIDILVGKPVGTHFAPPVEEFGLPMLERALQRAIVRKVDVVGDTLGIVDGHGLNPFPIEFRFTAGAEDI